MLERSRVENSPMAFAAEIGKAGTNPEVVLEATLGWYWAADVLAENGAAVHLAHPLGVKGFAYQRVEKDRRDARRLVRQLRAGELVAIRVPTREEEAMRDLSGTRGDAIEDLTRAKNRLGHFLSVTARSAVRARPGRCGTTTGSGRAPSRSLRPARPSAATTRAQSAGRPNLPLSRPTWPSTSRPSPSRSRSPACPPTGAATASGPWCSKRRSATGGASRHARTWGLLRARTRRALLGRGGRPGWADPGRQRPAPAPARRVRLVVSDRPKPRPEPEAAPGGGSGRDRRSILGRPGRPLPALSRARPAKVGPWRRRRRDRPASGGPPLRRDGRLSAAMPTSAVGTSPSAGGSPSPS